MYDSEYFRKVIGDNYNPNELYTNTTYNNNESGNIYTVSNNEERKINEVNARVISEPTSTITSTQIYEQASMTPYNVNKEPVSAQPYEPNLVQAPTQSYSVNTTPVSTKPYEQVNNINTEQYVNTMPSSQQLLYPEIYNVLKPMVNTVLENNKNMEYNEATINAMSNEIYNALEVDVIPQKVTKEVNSTNNVMQVNTQPKNYALHDLIKIMLIGQIEKNK